jgi:hypothetical protein
LTEHLLIFQFEAILLQEKQKEEVEVGKRRRKGRRLLIYKIYCKEFHFKTKA